MAKRTEEQRAQIRENLRHPIVWLKGEDLPPERIRPWEMAVQIVPKLVSGLRDGFTWNAVTMFQNVFGINKRLQTVASVSIGIFDGFNDPIVGAYMDTRNISVRTYRWIMRLNIFAQTVFGLLPMFNFNVTPWQRIGMYIAIKCLSDLIATPGSVANAKVWAHVTPYSKERAKLSWAAGLGDTIHQMVYPLYLVLIGLRDVLGWSEYSIYLFGALILTLPTLFLEMGPTFVLQRVPDKVNPKASEYLGLKGFLLEMKECFFIVRHNKYFMLNLAARFVTVFTPQIGDNDFYRYCGVDEVINTGSGRLRGEFLLWFRDNIVSIPGNFIVPFALPFIKKVGGPRNMQVLSEGVKAACGVLKWAVGMKSAGGVLFNWTMEMFTRTFARTNDIAGSIISYEMLDYVEWKTGRRSEGVNMAVNGLMSKIVLNNIDAVVGNLVIDALGFKAGAKQQPKHFLKWAPTLYLLVPAFDSFINFVARLLYKYPAEMRDMVEAELIERRKLTEQATEQATEQPA